jgi:ligand-binding sensor domain-containing protein
LYLQNKPYRIEHFTEHEGLPNNTIHGILEDAKANIWFSTNRGLVRYDRAKGSFKNFDANDGLKNNEFTDGAAFKARTSANLFFGGVDGLCILRNFKPSTTFHS